MITGSRPRSFLIKGLMISGASAPKFLSLPPHAWQQDTALPARQQSPGPLHCSPHDARRTSEDHTRPASLTQSAHRRELHFTSPAQPPAPVKGPLAQNTCPISSFNDFYSNFFPRRKGEQTNLKRDVVSWETLNSKASSLQASCHFYFNSF